MSEQDPRPADALTPAQSEAVRRLLAAARHDEGIPDDVAARLDAAIADLSAGRTGEVPSAPDTDGAALAPVIPLHRRRWPQVLVAAAAVTLFGFGIAQYDGGASQTGAGGGSTAEKNVAPGVASSQGGDLTESGAGSRSPAAPEFSAPQPLDNALDGLTTTSQRLSQRNLAKLGITELRKLRPGNLDRDLAALVPADSADAPSASQGYAADRVPARCGPLYTIDGGASFAASYRRHLALVLFHPELDGVRLVEIYDCDSTTPRRTIRTVTLQTGE
jgi:hypothetical protein